MKIKKKNGGASRRKALKPLYNKIKKSQERVFNQVRTLTLYLQGACRDWLFYPAG
jgi:hypothetical protein